MSIKIKIVKNKKKLEDQGLGSNPRTLTVVMSSASNYLQTAVHQADQFNIIISPVVALLKVVEQNTRYKLNRK